MALSDYDLHASIAVSDIQQAVAFYEGKLACRWCNRGQPPSSSRTENRPV